MSRKERERAHLDIDEVAIEAVSPADLLPPALTQEEIEAALGRGDVRPPEAEWRPLDPGSFALKLPGDSDAVRVTTRAAVFEDHADSHEFLSPGGELFERLAPELDAPDGEAVDDDQRRGHLWLRETPEGRREIVAMTRDGELVVESLRDLLDALGELQPGTANAGGPEEADWRPLA